MNWGIITAVLINLMFSKTIQGLFNIDLGFEVFWIWLNVTGVLISLVVAYVVSYLTSKVAVKNDTGVSFTIRKEDWQRKEVYILLGFFVVILLTGALVPLIFG